MATFKNTMTTFSRSLALVSLLAASSFTYAAEAEQVDSFDDTTMNSLGQPRQFMDDSMVGGKTHTKSEVANGVLHVKGTITPPRGQPGWASAVLPLDEMGKNHDASAYSGVKLRVKINQGALTVSANSTEVTNFDFHAAPVMIAADGQYHEVMLPFDSMKRAWSPQTELNTKTLNSVSIVAYSLQPADFDYEIDEVSFY